MKTTDKNIVQIALATATVLLCLLFSGCRSCSPEQGNDTSYLNTLNDDYSGNNNSEVGTETTKDYGSIKIPYTEEYGNTITIPVKINGMGLDMIYDTGASTTCITLAEAQYLYDKGNLSEEDLIDFQQFQTANGEIALGLRINLREVKIGDKITLHNIEALVVENQQAPLLLGQSVMKKFREISVDRRNKVVKFFE